MPEALGDAVCRDLPRLGNSLRQRDQIMLPIARGGGARKDPAASGADAVGGGFDPSGVELLRVTDKRRAEDIVLLDKDNALASLSSFECCGESGWPTADNKHITKCRALAKMIRVRLGRRIAKASRFADKAFVEHPAFGRTKKGFVVETCRQNRRGQAQYRADIERQVWPAVLAFGDEPFIDEHIGGAGIGFGSPTFAYGNQRIGFLDARRHNPARAVIFEAAGDKADAVAEKRGGQRVAFLCLIGFAVEAEFDHGNASGPTAWTVAISFVTRWRVMTIHARQPKVCRHISSSTPRGLLRVNRVFIALSGEASSTATESTVRS